MPFIESALTTGQIAAIRSRPHRADYYFLAWGGLTPEKIIVFKARVNQASFNASFATIVFDTVTKGAYTDAIEGYTIYLSSTNDIRSAYWQGRLRKDTTTTTLNVNETSITITDNDYIFVTKDTIPAHKTALINSSNTLFMDYDIAFREPPPIIYNMQTVYAVVMDSDGNADVDLFEPEAHAVTAGATISSWAWSADGGSFQVGGAGTQDVQIRYTTPGYYRPRVTVTDSNGLTSWFSPYVFVIPNDLSTVIMFGFDGISLSATIEDGWNATVQAFEGSQNLLDNTFVAVYEPGDHVTITSDITFCGRLRTETNTGTMTQQHGLNPTASFDIEGIATIMGRLISRPITYFDNSSPTKFIHIDDCTPWRAIGEFVREFTNINNTHSLYFDDVSNDFQFPSYSTGSTSTLDSIKNILFTNISELEFAPSGEMRIVRHANYLPAADRNALTTIANFTLKDDYATESGEGDLYAFSRDYIRGVGKNIVYGGSYDTTTGSVTTLKSTTPAVTQSDGNEKSETNRQVLEANQTSGEAEVELGQRAGDDFAAKQANPVLTVTYPDSYRWMIPSVSQWYTHTITNTENIRGISYDTNTRWLTASVDISYDLATQRRVVRVQHPIETTELGFATSIEEAPAPTQYSTPVQPVMDAFPGFLPETFGSDLPSGATAADEQPVTQDDIAPQSDAKDPQINLTIIEQTSGQTVMVWDDNNLWRTDTIGQISNPVWEDSKWSSVGTGTIQDAIWDSYQTGAAGYLTSNDGTDGYTYISTNVAKAFWFAGESIEGLESTVIRNNSSDGVIVYGVYNNPAGASWSVDLLDDGGGGQGDLVGSDLITPHASSQNVAGTYDSGNDKFTSNLAAQGEVTNVEWPIPPGATITRIRTEFTYRNFDASSGDKKFELSIDGVSLTTQDALGTIIRNLTMDVSGSWTGETILIHGSVRGQGVNAFCDLKRVLITGTSEADHAATATSSDRAATFANLKDVGLMDLGPGSFDYYRRGVNPLAAMNEKVRIFNPITEQYEDEADGAAGAGNYPNAIWGLGPDSDDYIFNTDAGTLYSVIDGTKTDITPAGGELIGKDCITANGQTHFWGLFDYSGTVKVSYTTNAGSTWTDSTTSVSNNASAIRVRQGNNNNVYVADGSAIWYSTDGGVSFLQKQSPSSNIKGIAIL
jgi:hypothetical protein